MLWMILIGLIIGIVARFLMPGRDPGGILTTIVLGIIGSALAGWLGVGMGVYTPGQPAGFIASVLGAMLILWAYRALRGRAV